MPGLTPRQTTILDALRSTGPLAGVFEAGARIRNDETFPGRQYMIGHAMRELINRLPDYYPDDDRVPKVDAPDRRYRASDSIRDLTPKWRTDRRAATNPFVATDGESASADERIGISAEIVRTIDEIVKYEDSVPTYRRSRFVRFLAVLQGATYVVGFDDIADGFLKIDGAGHAHVPRRDGQRDAAETIAQWDLFEDMLFGVMGPRHEVYAGIAQTVERLNRHDA